MFLYAERTSYKDLIQVQFGYSLFSLLALILFKNKCISLFKKIELWSDKSGSKYPRSACLLIFLTIVCTYQSKAFLGFWFAGILGWDYSDRKLKTSQEPKHLVIDQEMAVYFSEAIIQERSKYLVLDGYLEGDAMFLHFENGAVLPANNELLGFVFPQYVLTPENLGNLELKDSLLEILRKNLSERRNGRKFLLPTNIAYPAHAPYMPISYLGYPHERDLVGVSWWKLTINVNRDKGVDVVASKKLYEVGRT